MLEKLLNRFYIFLAIPDEVEKYVQSNSCNNVNISIMLRF